jgi:hypothetical protein
MAATDDVDREPAEPFGPLTRLGSGGQGIVYALPNTLIDGSWPAVYKKYNAAALAELDGPALAAMVRFLADLPPGDRRKLGERTAWPAELVEQDGRTAGFLMRQVPDEFTVRLRLPSGHVDKLAQVQLLLNDRQYLQARGLRIDDRFRLEFLRDTARTLAHLHGLGIIVGDLSPNNLLFSRTARPRCFLIDCDAMRLHGRSVLRQVETNDWQVPAGEELATTAADSYKFGLLCVRLFAGDQVSRDVRVLDRVDADLRGLTEAALTTGPGSRPSMLDWATALDRALERPGTSKSRRRLWNPATNHDPGRLPPDTTQVGPTGPAAPPHVGSTGPAAPPRIRATGPAVPPRPGRAGLAGVLIAALLLLCAAPQLAELAGSWWSSLPFLGQDTSTGNTSDGTADDPSGNPVEDPPGGTADDPSDDATGDSTDDTDADEQAAAIRTLLADSGRDRQRIAPAVQKVVGCTDLDGAAALFRRASAGRQAVLDRARDLRTDALPDGAELKEALVEALTHSRAADDAFARWADAVASSGCQSAAMHGSHRQEGDAESRSATAAKKRFVALWAEVAEPRGYPVPSYLEI